MRDNIGKKGRDSIYDVLQQKQQRIEELEKALTQINEMSDCGNYESAVINMKSIAQLVLKNSKEEYTQQKENRIKDLELKLAQAEIYIEELNKRYHQ